MKRSDLDKIAKDKLGPVTTSKQIGNYLRWLRELSGLTQAEVARMTGFTVSQISRYEDGGRAPSATMFFEITGWIGGKPAGALITEIVSAPEASKRGRGGRRKGAGRPKRKAAAK